MNTCEDTLQKFVERARTLYSLPAVALKVLELTGEPVVDNRALKKCIENDPALTAKVLRVVNSSLFGLSREVTDLSQALALLGVKPLKLLVLGFSLSDAVFSKFTGKAMVRYWRHTLTKAVAAREIAESICHIPGDEAFIAGLLQDIGMLVLLQELGESYAKLLSRPYASQRDLAAQEVETLGFDHTELTARLMAQWGMPKVLERAVSVREAIDDAGNGTSSAIARILHLAQILADLLVDARHDLLAQLLDPTATHCRLTHSQLTTLVANLQNKVAQLSDVFSLQMPPGDDYRDVLIRAQARMAEVSTELAAELVKPDATRTAVTCEAVQMLDDVQELSAAVMKFMDRPASKSPATVQETRYDGAERRKQPSTEATNAPAAPTAQVPRPASQAFSGAAIEGEAGLMHRLALMIHACRQSRWPVSLALVEIDRFPQLVLDHGPQQSARVARLVEEMCQHVDNADAVSVPLRPYSFAIPLANCDRTQAVSLCDDLLQEVRRRGLLSETHAAVSVSIGVASVEAPHKNFLPATLYESTARCLSSAQLSGGNTLKSIGIY